MFVFLHTNCVTFFYIDITRRTENILLKTLKISYIKLMQTILYYFELTLCTCITYISSFLNEFLSANRIRYLYISLPLNKQFILLLLTSNTHRQSNSQSVTPFCCFPMPKFKFLSQSFLLIH